MKGPAPNPAGVRALMGSRTRPHHKDRLPEEAEQPAPAAAVAVAAPSTLTRAERAYWAHFEPLLSGAKVLTPADVETLGDYCLACAAVADRSKRLRKAYRPPMVVDAAGKRTRGAIDQALVRMLDAQVRGWIERKTKLASELGLTAIARTRVTWSGHAQIVDPVKTPTSKVAQLQEQAASLRRPLGVAK